MQKLQFLLISCRLSGKTCTDCTWPLNSQHTLPSLWMYSLLTSVTVNYVILCLLLGAKKDQRRHSKGGNCGACLEKSTLLANVNEASYSKTSSSLCQRGPVVSAKPFKDETFSEEKTNATNMHSVQKWFRQWGLSREATYLLTLLWWKSTVYDMYISRWCRYANQEQVDSFAASRVSCEVPHFNGSQQRVIQCCSKGMFSTELFSQPIWRSSFRTECFGEKASERSFYK